jgi:hypothetical protein
MSAISMNGIKYIGLMNDNSFKSKSLEDNVYFTLRDIFWNCCFDDVISANHYNGLLTNNVSFEERDNNFRYSNLLYDYNSDFTKKLYNWLLRLTGITSTKPNGWKDSMFQFLNMDKPNAYSDHWLNDEEIDMATYMNYDDWWDQLKELIKKLKEQLEKHKKWEADDVQRDCDRLSELTDDN